MALRIPILALLLALLPAGALVVHVPADFAEVEDAMRSTAYGDTVLVAPGIYTEQSIPLFSGVTLLAEDMNPGATVLDAGGHTFVVVAEYVDSAARLRGFTLRGAAGSAMFLDQSHPQVSDCFFTQNDGYEGGAVLIWGSESRFERCRFSSNLAYRGGAVHMIESDSRPSFTDCEFYWNGSWQEGGAVWAQGAQPSFEGCVFFGNESFIDGGALFLDHCPGGAPEFSRCVFSGNRAAGFGGVGYFIFSSGLFDQCTLVDNSATGSGAAFFMDVSFPRLERSILAFNGPGSLMDCNTMGETRSLCCDFYGNEGGEEVCGLDLGGNFSAYPYFCDRDGGDWSLSALSPCLPLGNDCSELIGALGLGCNEPVDSPEIPDTPLLALAAFPNPFNPSTEIRFDLNTDMKVNLAVYDIAGRRIRTLYTCTVLEAGEHRVSWNGRDDLGRALSSGIYFLRLDSDREYHSLKLSLVR